MPRSSNFFFSSSGFSIILTEVPLASLWSICISESSPSLIENSYGSNFISKLAGRLKQGSYLAPSTADDCRQYTIYKLNTLLKSSISPFDRTVILVETVYMNYCNLQRTLRSFNRKNNAWGHRNQLFQRIRLIEQIFFRQQRHYKPN